MNIAFALACFCRNTNDRNGRTARFSSQKVDCQISSEIFEKTTNFGELYLCNHSVNFAQMSLEWKPTNLLSVGGVYYGLGMLSNQLMKRRKSENTGHDQYFEYFPRSVTTLKNVPRLSKNVFLVLHLILNIES